MHEMPDFPNRFVFLAVGWNSDLSFHRSMHYPSEHCLIVVMMTQLKQRMITRRSPWKNIYTNIELQWHVGCTYLVDLQHGRSEVRITHRIKQQYTSVNATSMRMALVLSKKHDYMHLIYDFFSHILRRESVQA